MSEVIEQERTELAPLPPQETALNVYKTPGGLDPWLEKIRNETSNLVPDLTTKKGRDEIASMAFKVRKAKTALDGLGKQLVDELKAVPKLVDDEQSNLS